MGFRSFYEQIGGAQEAMKPKRMNDSIVEVFGRHNPPHMGHGMTFDKANEIAGNENADQSFHTSRSQDPKKNPLPFQQKVGFLKTLMTIKHTKIINHKSQAPRKTNLCHRYSIANNNAD